LHLSAGAAPTARADAGTCGALPYWTTEQTAHDGTKGIASSVISAPEASVRHDRVVDLHSTGFGHPAYVAAVADSQALEDR
jgi:hypothetical protein